MQTPPRVLSWMAALALWSAASAQTLADPASGGGDGFDVDPKVLAPIAVTGYHIKRMDQEGPAPVIVFRREDLEAAGVNRVLAVDLHAGQIQGFFNVPFDHLYAMPALLQDHLKQHYRNAVIVSPDAGGVERARAYSKRLDGTLAIIDKRRERANESEVMNIIGEVEGKRCLIVDDILDTAGTMCNAARALKNAGAASVSASVTHGVLSGPAIERITESCLEEVIVTNSIPLNENAAKCSKIKVVSIAPLLAEAIRRIHHSDSVSSLFV